METVKKLHNIVKHAHLKDEATVLDFAGNSPSNSPLKQCVNVKNVQENRTIQNQYLYIYTPEKGCHIYFIKQYFISTVYLTQTGKSYKENVWTMYV